MSHLPERKEKICLNCGAATHDRFCHVCGQENIEPKESFWHLVTHFVYDIIHFDGKFFSTLKYLLFRPGYLSTEYIKGRRASYLHPIRMYVFTSAFFFLIFFSFYKGEEKLVAINETPNSATKTLRILKKSKEGFKKSMLFINNDSLKSKLIKKIILVDSDIALLQRDSTAVNRLQTFKQNDINAFQFDGRSYKTLNEYDTEQSKLPKQQRDGFFTNKMSRQNLHIKEKYHHNPDEIKEAFFEKFKHTIPQILFTGLPLFALLLLLLYNRHNIHFVNHLVFLIHLFCASFIIILSGLWLDSILSWANMNAQKFIFNKVVSFAILFYWYKAMRNFYLQRRAKTISKYIIFLFAGSFIMILVFSIFLFFSAMTI